MNRVRCQRRRLLWCLRYVDGWHLRRKAPLKVLRQTPRLPGYFVRLIRRQPLLPALAVRLCVLFRRRPDLLQQPVLLHQALKVLRTVGYPVVVYPLVQSAELWVLFHSLILLPSRPALQRPVRPWT